MNSDKMMFLEPKENLDDKMDETIIIRLVCDYDDGGIRQSERQYIPEFKKQGVKVIGIVIGKSYGNYKDQKEDFEYFFQADVHSYRGGLFTRGISLLKNSKRSRKLVNKLLRELLTDYPNINNYNIVINIRRVNLIPIALLLSKKLNGKVNYHSGVSFNPGPLHLNSIYYSYLKQLTSFKILANSKFSAMSYGLSSNQYIYPGFSSDRVDKNYVCKAELREKLGIVKDVPTFLYLARVDWDKAPDILLEGFLESELAAKLQAQLIIAGPIKNKDLKIKLITIINKYKAFDRIYLVGAQKNVSDWYNASDVFVNSRRNIEPFGISIVEAMGAGLPILSSAYGGPSETVCDNKNGWLIYDLTIEGYHAGVDRTLTNRHLWSKYGEESKKLSYKFSVEHQVSRYINEFC